MTQPENFQRHRNSCRAYSVIEVPFGVKLEKCSKQKS